MSSLTPLQCPTCRRTFQADLTSPFMPFCSKRCKMADLNRWFNEEVGLPINSSEPEDDDEEPPPPPQVREWKFE